MSAAHATAFQVAHDLEVDWPAVVRVGEPFEVRARWTSVGDVALEAVPDSAAPGDLWAPFEARPVGPAEHLNGRSERRFELLLLDPPLDGAQLGAALTVPGPEVWLRPVGGGAVDVRTAPPAELVLEARVDDAQLVRFERLPWSFEPPSAPAWPLWVGALVALGVVAARAPRWLARARAARERRAPLRSIEAWLSATNELDGEALHAVAGHLRGLALDAAGEDVAGFTVEEARAAGAPAHWPSELRDVLWRWWSADQSWSYGGRLPAPDAARALTADLRQALPQLRERIGARP